MFKIPIIVFCIVVSIASPGVALILLPIAWVLFDQLKAKHRENKRVLQVFIEHQTDAERHKAARAFL